MEAERIEEVLIDGKWVKRAKAEVNDNDNFLVGFDFDYVLDQQKLIQEGKGGDDDAESTVIEKLEVLSGIEKNDKNAAEYVCDLLLKDKSSLFYSRAKIEEFRKRNSPTVLPTRTLP